MPAPTTQIVHVRVLLFASYAERLGLEDVRVALPARGDGPGRPRAPAFAARRRAAAAPSALRGQSDPRRPRHAADRGRRAGAPAAAGGRLMPMIPDHQPDRPAALAAGSRIPPTAGSPRFSGWCGTTTAAAAVRGSSTRPTARWRSRSARASWPRRSRAGRCGSRCSTGSARWRSATWRSPSRRRRASRGGVRGLPLRDRGGQAPGADLEAGVLRDGYVEWVDPTTRRRRPHPPRWRLRS